MEPVSNEQTARERKAEKPLRVLMITQWFDPEPTFKGLLFAQELQRLGHDVEVLTGFPNYPGGRVYAGYRIRPFEHETMAGIKILRVPLYPSHDGSGIRRALNYVSFALSATVGALLMRRPDVAYVYHPPATVGLPAMVLKVLKGVPFVYDIQDLWPDTLSATGMLGNRFALAAVGAFMARIYRSASRVVVLSPGFKETLTTRMLPARRIDVIPNWADEDQISIVSPSAARAAELGFSGKFTVTFAGNMGKAQSLETLLDAASILKDEPAVRFLLVGGGLETQRLIERAADMGVDNVEFMKRRPISEIGEILSLSDVLLVHLRKDPLFEITIPSKTQAYLMAGRPILMGVAGDAARVIEQAGAGRHFAPENAQELADAVRDFMRMTPEERARIGAAGRKYYEDELSLAVGARRFAEVLERASFLKPIPLALKRLLDISMAGLALVLLSLPLAVVAIMVRFKLGAPVIFKQVRPGKDGELFTMYKFRTMTEKVDSYGALAPDRDRLTRFGSFLRASSLDELPELWNVLRGHMSLVGPRPLLQRYTEYFTHEETIRLTVKPGITGWAQVNGRNDASWDSRLGMDVWYVRNLSIGLDMRILGRTVASVFRRRGVVVDPESTMQNLDDERRRVIVE